MNKVTKLGVLCLCIGLTGCNKGEVDKIEVSIATTMPKIVENVNNIKIEPDIDLPGSEPVSVDACIEDNTFTDEVISLDVDINTKSTKEDFLYGIESLGYGYNPLQLPIKDYLTDKQLEKMEIVLDEGDEFYIIVPKSKTAYMEIYEYEVFSEKKVGDLIYKSRAGNPVLLRCNISDLHPNTIIKLIDGEEYISFSPTVSLVDGTVVVGEKGKIITPNKPENLYIATLYDELGEDYFKGLKCMELEDEYINGRYSKVYGVVEDHEEHIVTRERYGVSVNGDIYQYDIMNGYWININYESK